LTFSTTATATTAECLAAGTAASLTALLACLGGIDLAVGEFAGADAAIWLAVLFEAVVF
jgi:hypothetical protein